MPKKKKNDKTLTGLEGLAKATSITPEDVALPPNEAVEDEETSAEDQPVAINMLEHSASKEEYYEPRMWNNKIPVYRCKACDHFAEKESDMILHVLKHVPAKDRNAVLDDLTR